jgi:hypothetical protein
LRNSTIVSTAYQILVYYNCKTNKDNPKVIKYMLGT